MSEAHAEGERAVAVGHNTGIASTGDNAQNVLITMPGAGLPSVAETAAPAGTARLGASRGAGAFVGREAELAALGTTAGDRHVLVGLGGSGKSTLARRFAQLRREHDNPVWWIDGRSKELIESGLAELAARLAPVFAGIPVPLAASWVRSWLACHSGWLLVLDDVDGPDEVRALLEGLPDGRFLITSRQGAGWQGLARPVRVGQLEAGEAVELLVRVIRDASGASVDSPDLADAADLCDRLGCLPLALEQAGAFIGQNASTPKRYLELLQADGAGLLDRGSVGGDPARTVARVWRVTFDRLADDGAIEVLRVLAWFAPTGIPRGNGVPVEDPVAIAAAANLLAAYHLITLTPDAISVHPLVQEITRTVSGDDPHRAAQDIERARRLATSLLLWWASRFRGNNPALWPARRRLFPHIEAIAARTDPEHDDEELLTLFNWLGQSLQMHGEYRRAVKPLTRAKDGFARLYGADHEKTLHNCVSLGQVYNAAGDSDEANAIYQDTYERAARSLGPAHWTTLTVQTAIALARSAAGDHDGAIAAMSEAVEIGLAQFGPEHPFTDMAENNLAVVLSTAGRAEKAAQIYEDRYHALLERFGPDDLATLVSSHNLAFAIRQVGELERAITLLEDVVERRSRVMGEEHPDTLKSLGNLMVMTGQAGDLVRMKELAERLLAGRERVLGPDHPDTRDTREALKIMNQELVKREGTPEGEPGPGQEQEQEQTAGAESDAVVPAETAESRRRGPRGLFGRRNRP